VDEVRVHERVRQIVAGIGSRHLVSQAIEQRQLADPDLGEMIVQQFGRGCDLLARATREREVMPRSSGADTGRRVCVQAPQQGAQDRRRPPRPQLPVVLQKAGHEHTLALELGHRLGMRATLSWEAGALQRPKERCILTHAGRRPPGKDSCHPPRAVPMVDPDHPDVERRHLRHLDPVAALQMPLQTVQAQWFTHPSGTITAPTGVSLLIDHDHS
jgi:hypothetical protein